MQGWGKYLLHELTMLNINITAYGISKLPHMRMRASEKAEGASSASAARVGGILPLFSWEYDGFPAETLSK